MLVEAFDKHNAELNQKLKHTPIDTQTHTRTQAAASLSASLSDLNDNIADTEAVTDTETETEAEMENETETEGETETESDTKTQAQTDEKLPTAADAAVAFSRARLRQTQTQPQTQTTPQFAVSDTERAALLEGLTRGGQRLMEAKLQRADREMRKGHTSATIVNALLGQPEQRRGVQLECVQATVGRVRPEDISTAAGLCCVLVVVCVFV